MKMKFIICFFIIALTNILAQWEQTNGPNGGIINTLMVTDSCIYAGTTNGISISRNDGINWDNIGLSDLSITALAEFGTNIFAGTDANGIYSSSNNGNTWISLNPSLPTVKSIISKDGSIFVGTNYGLFISKDNGKNWNEINTTGLVNKKFNCLVSSSSAIYAGTDFGLFRSTDNGSSWEILGVQGYQLVIFTIGLHDSSIYVGTSQGFYISHDDGKNWFQTQPKYQLNILSISVVDHYILAGTTQGVYFSNDSGLNWTLVGFTNLIVKSGIINYKSNTLFAGTYNGIFISKDLGKTWFASGMPRASIFLLKNNGNDIYAITGSIAADGGIYSSDYNGLNWIYKGLLGKRVNCIAFNANYIFAGTSEGIYKSTDDGISWSSITPPFMYSGIKTIYSVDSSVYTSANGWFYTSSDNGNSWSVSSNFDATAITSVGNNILAGNQYGIYLSSDNGVSWKLNTNSLGYVYSFLMKGTIIYAATWKGIYISTDNGNSWIENDTVLKGLIVSSISISGSKMFASTNENVYLSEDDGISWSKINTEFPKGDILSLFSDEKYIYVGIRYQGVWRSLISEIITGINQSEILPTRFYLSQNYPNPFNPTTTIKYEILTRSNVKIEVFDVLGREIQTLVNKELDAGNYKVSFNAYKLSSGIYFYKITTNNFIQTKKMILLK